MEAVEPARIRNELWPLCLEHFPDRLLGQLGMTVRLGVDDALVGEPGIQLVVAFEPKPRREEALTYEPDLVLDLTLLPTGCRRASVRIPGIVISRSRRWVITVSMGS